MAGRYGTLTAASGYLGHFATLVTERATRAEAEADLMVDREFNEWNRATWSPTGRPQDVGTAWDLWATATYIQLDALANNPGTLEFPTAVQDMKSEAMAHIDRTKDRGYVIGATGDRQSPENSDDPTPGGISVRASR